jgi:serine protease AprX
MLTRLDYAPSLSSTTLVRRLLTLAAVAALAIPGASLGAITAESGRPPAERLSVIVRELPGSEDGPEQAVRTLGGKAGRQIEIINGFAAEIPRGALARLRDARGVHSVTLNRRVRLNAFLDGWDVDRDVGSMFAIAQEMTGAAEYWNNRWTGKGVDVALIDTGVVPVNGLATPGKVVHGPDLSFESQADNLRHLDTFGHGTHMAGIIAGRDDEAPPVVQKGMRAHFLGMAPDARIVSVKVADAYGATDVSQVIAAIDWVVQHRRDNGLNIRVLNLSFGTDGEQDYRIDPLAYAVEVAWRKGIVVVVSAGNGGFGSRKLNNPAYDPFVIAVGGSDGKGTYDSKDDTVPAWSSYGDGMRNPDLVAPGKSVVSLRAPGSIIDLEYPTAHVGDSPRFFRGSGTSQSAAVVSGAAALIIQQRPKITPDQLKALLEKTASRLPVADPRGQGAGMLNLKIARDTATPKAVQTWEPATGTGSLELARGSSHVSDGAIALEGEQDIFGASWDGLRWSADSWNETSWSGGLWNGMRWSGDSWNGLRWSGAVWNGLRWSGLRWSDATWSSSTWNGLRWSGDGWLGLRWSGETWSGLRWSGLRWSNHAWGS